MFVGLRSREINNLSRFPKEGRVFVLLRDKHIRENPARSSNTVQSRNLPRQSPALVHQPICRVPRDGSVPPSPRCETARALDCTRRTIQFRMTDDPLGIRAVIDDRLPLPHARLINSDFGRRQRIITVAAVTRAERRWRRARKNADVRPRGIVRKCNIVHVPWNV
jgi:hypothetical protein